LPPAKAFDTSGVTKYELGMGIKMNLKSFASKKVFFSTKITPKSSLFDSVHTLSREESKASA
jgi:hypothetical protein